MHLLSFSSLASLFLPISKDEESPVSAPMQIHLVVTTVISPESGLCVCTLDKPHLHHLADLRFVGDILQILVFPACRVLNTYDYVLILGMPGTGKTSTIVQAIKGLVAQGKRVLLSSYTNSAVDTVLAKLVQENIQFLRLGRKEAVHPLVQRWVLGGPQYSDTSVQGLRQLSESAQVVCCNVLQEHPSHSTRQWSYSSAFIGNIIANLTAVTDRAHCKTSCINTP